MSDTSYFDISESGVAYHELITPYQFTFFQARSRQLASTDIQIDVSEFSKPLQCANPGEVPSKFDWDGTALSNTAPNPQISQLGDFTVAFSKFQTGSAEILGFTMKTHNGFSYPALGVRDSIVAETVIESGSQTNAPAYPAGYVTMEIVFLSQSIKGLSISIGDVDSSEGNTDAVRISMFDASDNDVPLALALNHPLAKMREDYSWMNTKSVGVDNPGFGSSMYAKPQDSSIGIKKIHLDLGLYGYTAKDIGKSFGRWIYPALEFNFCADPFPTSAPVVAPVAPTLAPTTAAPVIPAPVLVATPAPVAPPVTIVTATSAPVLVHNNPGVNGDPIIMGLAGQIFKFEGRSGAWYSAVSAKSFQWNMKTQKFDGCPMGSDTFLTGVGLTVFGTTKTHQVEINVVNPYTVNSGCGNEVNKDFDYGCLGAGSLELVIDGHKVVQSIDMPFDDNTGRVIAFNTIGKCSRRWFDFDITPREDRGLRHGKSGRALDVMLGAGIFDVLGSTKDTAVDQDGCSAWTAERKERNDILKQTGTFSTIVIKTEKISFHVEYHQEWERCNAHSLDIWISEVHPDVVEEQWEGVIGETKDLGYDNKKGEKRYMNRESALQFKNDEDYEVVSPYSTSCKACVPRKERKMKVSA